MDLEKILNSNSGLALIILVAAVVLLLIVLCIKTLCKRKNRKIANKKSESSESEGFPDTTESTSSQEDEIPSAESENVEELFGTLEEDEETNENPFSCEVLDDFFEELENSKNTTENDSTSENGMNFEDEVISENETNSEGNTINDDEIANEDNLSSEDEVVSENKDDSTEKDSVELILHDQISVEPTEEESETTAVTLIDGSERVIVCIGERFESKFSRDYNIEIDDAGTIEKELFDNFVFDGRIQFRVSFSEDLAKHVTLKDVVEVAASNGDYTGYKIKLDVLDKCNFTCTRTFNYRKVKDAVLVVQLYFE